MTIEKTSYQFDTDDKKIIEMLANHFGVSRTGVLRMLIRRAAREEGITIPTTERSLEETPKDRSLFDRLLGMSQE